ncbi:MAG TPA: hypothetical protein ENI33_09635 [Thermoplasmatales archaeon]|nr:hypothetical protein [Thermoplasmatales archaeon]
MKKKDIKKILAVGLLVGIMLVLVPISKGYIYDFNNPDSKAYEGEADYHPPNDVYIGGEMGAQDYIALQASDDVHAYYSADWWYYEFHRFAFKINETLDKKQFYVVYEGYAVNGSHAGLKIYVWNNYSNEWEYLGVHYGRNDGIIKAFITGNLSHYINETGYLNILAETTYRTSCPFYYSYDGNNYILDGEGLLYSMLPWFERSSVVTLEKADTDLPFLNLYFVIVRARQ